MGISLGLVGLGEFGRCFAPLFKAHPAVDRIALCDTEPERIKRFADDPFFKDKFNEKDAYSSLDEILESDLDALVVITQHWLHAPQAIKAMEHGKHVYSAVPVICVHDPDEILDWCDKIVNTCLKTGMKYMMGETSYYRAQTMYCREKAAEGAFGDFVYAEGEYIHPYDWPVCDLREVQRLREASKPGREWAALKNEYIKRGMYSNPMAYPTHSTSGPISVMGAHAVKVAAAGYKSKVDDSWLNDCDFSNMTALFQMSNGSAMRICELREVAYSGDEVFEHEIFRIFGTKGTFRENRWFSREKSAKIPYADMRSRLPAPVDAAFTSIKGYEDYGGHGGSHAYLVHEFCDAIANDRMPLINAWEAARYTAPGCAAHKSALKGGELIDVPDWGDAPA